MADRSLHPYRCLQLIREKNRLQLTVYSDPSRRRRLICKSCKLISKDNLPITVRSFVLFFLERALLVCMCVCLCACVCMCVDCPLWPNTPPPSSSPLLSGGNLSASERDAAVFHCNFTAINPYHCLCACTCVHAFLFFLFGLPLDGLPFISEDLKWG